MTASIPADQSQIFSDEEFAQIREGIDNATDELGVAKVIVGAIIAKASRSWSLAL